MLQGFWAPAKRQFLAFFLKFILFTLIALGLWLGIGIGNINIPGLSLPYNYVLKSWAVFVSTHSLPMIDYKFSTERGIFEVMYKPMQNPPVPLVRTEPVAFKLTLNTLHFNVIPFLALILSSPITDFRKFGRFLLIGAAVLFVSHCIHIYLDLIAYYQKFQLDNNYLSMQISSSKEYAAFQSWKLKFNAILLVQSFMEQAGSMILPALLWMIFARNWIFGVLLQKVVPPKN
jgi:hypothetical protein